MSEMAFARNLSVREACEVGGWSRSWFYAQLQKADSEVPRPIKIGNRTFVRRLHIQTMRDS